MYKWITMYEYMGDKRLGVKVGPLISANDGDVGIAAALEEIVQRLPNKTYIDIGADEGWWSLFVRERSLNAEIIAFEPNPKNFQTLKKNTEFKNIKIFDKAISDKEGTLLFTLIDSSTNSRSAKSSGNPQVELHCSSIIPFLGDNNIIKIDTEGHDIIIVKTLIPYLSKIDTLIFEFSIDWYENKEEAVQLLKKLLSFYKYMYFINRRGIPVFSYLNDTNKLQEFIYYLYSQKQQIDILCSNHSFTKINLNGI